jgi:uncharacterized protein YdeI (YjbR/CyaY-like superfamily)
MPSRPEPERVHCETVQAWRAWLDAQGDRTEGVWLIGWKKVSGKPAMTYDESVRHALCFGWVDSKTGSLDGERSMLWFAPRRKGSGWSRTNKVRVEELLAEGLMTPRGQAVIDAAKADGTWTMLDDVENLVIPKDLAAAFRSYPGSRKQFEAFPRSVKRGILEWIVQAKKPETRANRIADTAEKAQRGERANQWSPKA